MDSKKVKKKWLVLMIARAITKFLIIGFLAYWIIAGMQLASNEKMSYSQQFFSLLYAALLGFVFSSLGAYIYYRCAYKKPGTALLSFTLFSFVLYVPFLLFNNAKQIFEIIGMGKIAAEYPEALLFSYILGFVFCLNFVSELIDCCWIYYSFKLRKINKVLQAENILQVPEFKLIIESMEAAANQEDLNMVYGKEASKYPQISWYVKKRYNEMLANFKNNHKK